MCDAQPAAPLTGFEQGRPREVSSCQICLHSCWVQLGRRCREADSYSTSLSAETGNTACIEVCRALATHAGAKHACMDAGLLAWLCTACCMLCSLPPNCASHQWLILLPLPNGSCAVSVRPVACASALPATGPRKSFKVGGAPDLSGWTHRNVRCCWHPHHPLAWVEPGQPFPECPS
jgi:hypothetical protein